MLTRLQRRMTYLPVGTVPPRAAVLPAAEEVTVTTDDGLELAAWWLTSGGGTAPGVLVLHGNGGNRGGRSPLARALAGRGLHVLLLDYRGYGGNPGAPSEEGLYEDGRAGAAWLSGRPEVGQVVLFGESLGAAVAVREACRRPPGAVVLRSPFTSLPAVARHHWPFLPAAAVPERYASVERVGSLGVPLLVIAGDADGIVPHGQSRELFEAAAEPKRFVTVPDADHNDPTLVAGPRVVDAVDAFLTTHLPGRA